jgi:hypothetical protein
MPGAEIAPADATEDQPIEQQLIQFMGDELAAAMTAGGVIYVTFPGICTALGLSVEGQLQRIRRTDALRSALRRIPLATRGGVQRINCLRIDKLALWLAGVETARVKPTYHAKIAAYQDELAPLATQVFMRVLGVQPVPESQQPAVVSAAQVAEIAAQIETLTGVVAFLREHLDAQLAAISAATNEQIGALSVRLDDAVTLLEALGERQADTAGQVARIDERTQRLTPAHARALQEQINRMVYDTRHLAQPLTYAIIYGRLKQRFRASTYREIADEQYPAVMAYLQDELRRALAGEGPAQKSLF